MLRAILCTIVLSASGLGSTRSHAQVYPPGFQDEFVVGGFQEPTTFVFVPDGRTLVAERQGRVRVVQNGTVLAQSMLSVQAATGYEQGLLGMALAPGFPAPPYLYVCYSYDAGSDNFNRVSRWTVSGNTVVPGSEFVLIEDIPTGQGWHVAGCIRFAPDGNLLISMGDAGHSSRVQQLGRLEGKLLRLRPDGGIPADNPFIGIAGARPEIYQTGLRNPFRFCIQPNTGVPFIGDVGYNSWEEVNTGPAGANFGWPVHEGMANPPSASYTNPLYAYDHGLGSAAIAGNTFHPGTGLPQEYAGNYFFIDHVRGHLGRIVLNANNQVVSADPRWIEVAATGWGAGPVELAVGAEGALYYLVYQPGSLRRIVNTQAQNAAPTAFAAASPTAGNAPLVVLFDAAGSFDPDGDALEYSWDFGDGSAAGSGAQAQHTYTSNGTHDAVLTVRDGRGGESSAPAIAITVGNTPPDLTIELTGGSTFMVDTEVRFSGHGVDLEDGAVAPSALHWRVDLHHLVHFHPVIADLVGIAGSFIASSHGENLQDIFYRITLSATDSSGLTGTRSVDVHPDPSQFVVVPPAIASTPPAAAQVGALYTYAAVASGDTPMLWSLPVAPTWLGVGATGVVGGTPSVPGSYEIRLLVRNGGGQAMQEWKLEVSEGASGPQIVVPLGAQWRYLRGSSDPGPAWAEPGFDDAGWSSGPSGFGYGDNDDATVLEDMRGNYSTVFTRRHFEIAAASQVTEITVLYDVDDGCAAFLNGTRFWAVNAPATITAASFALHRSEPLGSLQRQGFTDAATLALLRDGDNVLAVVGLNNTLTSSDLTLKIELEITSASGGTPVAAIAGPEFDHRAAPNPFAQSTSVAFVAERAGTARLYVFDVRGRLLRTVLVPHLQPGPQRIVWDGRDAAGRWAPAGAYAYRLEVAGARIVHGKLTRTR